MNFEMQHPIHDLKKTGVPLREIWRFILESPRAQELKDALGGEMEAHLWSFLISPELESLWREPTLPSEENGLPSWKTIVRLSPDSKFRLKVLTLWHQSPFSLTAKLPIFFEFLMDPEPEIRWTLLEFLNDSATILPEMASCLMNCLSQENYLPAQLSSLHLLEKLGSENATLFLPLLSKLLEEENGPLRHKVVEVLGQWNVPETLPLLQKGLNDPELYVRRTTEKILQKRGILVQTPENPFSKILEMDDWYAKSEAVLALSQHSGTVQEQPSLEFLLQLLRQDENPYVRVSAVTALAKYPKSESLLSALQTAVSDSSSLVRCAILQTWGQLSVNAEDVLAFLPTLLQDLEPAVRLSATKLTGFLGLDVPEIRDILTQHIRSDSESKVCQMAIKALTRFSPHEKIQKSLHIALQDSHGEVRSAAIQALVKQYPKTEDLFPKLIPFLKDPNEEVREITLRVLAQIVPDASTILEILSTQIEQESNWNVRATMAEILGNFQPFLEERKNLLLKLLNDSEEYVQWEAIVALKKIGESSLLKPVLQRLEKSKDSALCNSAKEMLKDVSSF